MIKQYNQYIYKDGQWLLVGVSDQNNFITYVLQKDGDTITLKGDDDSTSDVVIKEFSDEAKAKLENIAAGAQVNVLEGVKVNGTKLTIDGEKLVDISVPTKLSQLTNDADYVTDANYVHTDNNYTTAEKNKLAGIAASADVNTIEQIKVNNSALTPDGNKIVNITVPTKLTDLTNDNNFVTDANYVHTDNNYTTAEKNKLAGLSNYDDTEIKQQIAQAGKIDTIKVNGTAQPVVDKTVSLTIPTVPTNISAFTNDKNYQTEDEVTSLIADAVGEIQTLEYSVVGSLPATGETGVIYLVSNGGANPNIYDEYIYINGNFEKIGTTEIDLSGYLTKTEAGETYARKAEVIQSDWSQNDSNQLDYVKNRTHYEIDNVVSNVIISNKECAFTITGSGDAFTEIVYDYTEEELAKINNLQDGPATIKVSINGHNFESAIEISNKTFESDLIRISTIDPHLYFIKVTDSRVAIGYEAIGYENAGDNYTINLIIEQSNKEVIKLDRKFMPYYQGDNGAEAFNETCTATGENSHAEGEETQASGARAHAEGYKTTASGSDSHAEGNNSISEGDYSHTEGYKTIAEGNSSHAEGSFSIAEGQNSHVEGSSIDYRGEDGGLWIANPIFLSGATFTPGETRVTFSDESLLEKIHEGMVLDFSTESEEWDWGEYVYRVGYFEELITIDTKYSNWIGLSRALTEEEITDINNKIANYEGDLVAYIVNYAKGMSSHSEGMGSIAKREGDHAEGIWTIANGKGAHAEGQGTHARANAAHAEGSSTYAEGRNSHAEGGATWTSMNAFNSHAEGTSTRTFYEAAHAEGKYTAANSYSAHAEGYETYANGWSSHAEGARTVTLGEGAHAEGGAQNPESMYFTAESISTSGIVLSEWDDERIRVGYLVTPRYSSIPRPVYIASVNKNSKTITMGPQWTQEYVDRFLSDADNDGTCKIHVYVLTVADGTGSHAEGSGTYTEADHSHAEGEGTYAASEFQHVQGKYNEIDSDGKYAHIVGNGEWDWQTDAITRSNAHTLDWDGNAWYSGKITAGADPVDAMDVVTKQYLENNSSAGGFYIKGKIMPNDELASNPSVINDASSDTTILNKALATPGAMVFNIDSEYYNLRFTFEKEEGVME